MQIRQANLQDIPTIVEMKMAMFREAGSFQLLQDGAEERIAAAYRDLYQQQKCCHYLVEDEGVAVACGGAVIKDDVPFCFFKTPCYGYIMDVYCEPASRRRGYATQLVQQVIAWLRERGVHNIKLKPSGAGQRMYQKLGFQPSGEMELWI